MTRVLLTPNNDILLVREFLWAGEHMDTVNEYSIKIGYSGETPMYICWFDDDDRKVILFNQSGVDWCEDLGDLDG